MGVSINGGSENLQLVERTTGLCFQDVAKLLEVLHTLADGGITVLAV